ncbi:MAG TPA: hypothetical protein VGS60_07900 [Actinomycetes bacterium]|nr:hypothetical protein [Actinomycetes bacterium]
MIEQTGRPASGKQPGRPPIRDLEARIAGDVLAAVERLGPVTGDDLRQLVRGQGRRVVVRMLVAGGRLRRDGRAGYVLAGTPR